MQFRTITKPERKADVPQPHTKVARRVDLPDGVHWVNICGGYSHEERRFNGWWWEQIEEVRKLEDRKKREAGEEDLNAYLATFFGSHIVDHNLTYAGTDEPLPKDGFDLFWELSAENVMGLWQRMLQPVTFFEDPKAAASSTTG